MDYIKEAENAVKALRQSDLNRSTVETELRAVHQTFIECYDLLDGERRLAESRGNDLLIFQEKLGAGLWRLSELNFWASELKRSFIARKRDLNKDRFSQEMAALDKYKLGARRLAATGQMIGDAFIWPFYRSSGDILIEHSKKSYQPFIPSGLGGLGELKFISGQKKLLDHFVIYHGVTSFLRMGDISLVDVNTQAVVALGDIKTSVDGQKMNIRVGLSFVAKTDSNIYEKMLDLRKRPRQPRRGNQQHRAETKLDEQVIEFKNAMLAGHTTERMSRRQEFKGWQRTIGDAFEKMEKDSIEGFAVAPDMLVVAYRGNNSMPDRLLDEPAIREAAVASSIGSLFAGIMNSTSDYNLIHMLSIGRDLNGDVASGFGMAPVYWSSYGQHFRREIIFGTSVAFLAWNQAKFCKHLVEAGWNIEVKGRKLASISRVVGHKTLRFEGIGWLVSCVPGQGYKTDDLIALVQTFTSAVMETKDRDGAGGVQVNLVISPPLA